jgi:hypothetical protein
MSRERRALKSFVSQNLLSHSVSNVRLLQGTIHTGTSSCVPDNYLGTHSWCSSVASGGSSRYALTIVLDASIVAVLVLQVGAIRLHESDERSMHWVVSSLICG